MNKNLSNLAIDATERGWRENGRHDARQKDILPNIGLQNDDTKHNETCYNTKQNNTEQTDIQKKDIQHKNISKIIFRI